MLDLAADKNIRTWSDPIAISDNGIHEGLLRNFKYDTRYSFLTDYDKQFLYKKINEYFQVQRIYSVPYEATSILKNLFCLTYPSLFIIIIYSVR